jgi:predicted RNase H-like HicB family nuclease
VFDEYPGQHRAKYPIVIEPTGTGFSAYSPALPGCVSTGATRDEVERNMQEEAIELHLEGLREEGYPVPEPSASSAWD